MIFRASKDQTLKRPIMRRTIGLLSQAENKTTSTADASTRRHHEIASKKRQRITLQHLIELECNFRRLHNFFPIIPQLASNPTGFTAEESCLRLPYEFKQSQCSNYGISISILRLRNVQGSLSKEDKLLGSQPQHRIQPYAQHILRI